MTVQRLRTAVLVTGTASMLALTGCAQGQALGPPCPVFDYDVFIHVDIATELEVYAVGICDEYSCSTDESIDSRSWAGDLSERYSDGVWEWAVTSWMPDTVGFVAIVAGEEIDLGVHDLEQAIDYPAGPDCGGIPYYERLTLEL